MGTSNATVYLAEFLAISDKIFLDEKIVLDYKRSFLDYLACVITGSREKVVEDLANTLLDADSHQKFEISDFSKKFHGKNLAFVNGVRAHSLDYDDGYTQGSCHPGAVVFSAVFAASKKYGSDSRKIMRAVIAGYEAMLRISSTVHPTTAKYGFHNTAVAGVFGAAAGVAVILGLDSKKTVNALGLAASYAGGLLQFLEDGSDAKRLHAGKAAHDGMLCAEMAANGISGPTKALEGNFGFFKAYARNEIRGNFLSAPFDTGYLISQTYIKLYPCCRHYHAAVDAATELRNVHQFKNKDIEKIEIGLYGIAVEGHDQKEVRNLMEAQMSAPCAVSLGLLDGVVTQNSFQQKSLNRPELKHLMSLTDTYVDAECERNYPAMRSGFVKIKFRNGSSIEKRVHQAKGESANPLTEIEIERKFLENTKPLIGFDVARSLVDKVWRFNDADLKDIYEYI